MLPAGHGPEQSTSASNLHVALLQMLSEAPAHGYGLLQRLSSLGVTGPSRVYRALKQLEKTGLVACTWEMPPAGPARRVYSVSPAGAIALTTGLAAQRESGLPGAAWW